MAQAKRTQIKFKQKLKRKKRRIELKKTGKNPDEYFYSGVYVHERLK